ncbi:MAG: glycosyltransferase family protein [Betaproteobacteria bacterium]|nr:glycosyltransferase family protein [Betaproteobacteria bacterium]
MAKVTLTQVLQHAVDAFQRGHWSEVERVGRGILATNPNVFEAYYLLGLAAERTGRAEESVNLLAAALRLNARHPEAHFNQGVALAQLGRVSEALSSYDRAIEARADFADAHFNRGVALVALGRTAEALAAYERAVALAPSDAQARHNLGTTLVELKRPVEALAAFDEAVALNPRYARAFSGRGVALWNLGRLDEALESCDRALALDPAAPGAWINRAIVLLDLDRPAEALESCDRSLALEPADANAHYNRGNALRELGRLDEAVAGFERAVALDPMHAAAHWNLADGLLTRGQFARGWDEYEWRWRLASRSSLRREIPAPLWLGKEALEGRTILLHSELGLGDTLQFCRYAALVARRGAKVVLEVQAPLVEFLRTLEGPEEVLASGAALPPLDFHCPLMSLPLAFRTDVSDVPAEVPYLRADPARAAAWRERLGAGSLAKVGIAWSGSTGLRNDRRSMALADMLPLLGPGADWISLQKEVRDADSALLAQRADLRDFAAELTDFAETAALVEALDLVVTVDTSVAHVAGALGKPVWILLPHVPHDWRWLRDRDDSLWYPGARLFRQPTPGDWAGVIRAVAERLRQSGLRATDEAHHVLH